jgi:quercetin dioxygenase-like cupin family protein
MSEKTLISPGFARVLSLAEETQFSPNGIVSRTLLQTENLRLVLFGFAEGQELTEHTTTQHATVHILSGECDFSVGSQTHRLKPGDLLYLPPGAPHAVKAVGRFSMLLSLARPASHFPLT